jgi:hypothetical protein
MPTVESSSTLSCSIMLITSFFSSIADSYFELSILHLMMVFLLFQVVDVFVHPELVVFLLFLTHI